jgi:DNA mismatch endonuclease, patch repair protein
MTRRGRREVKVNRQPLTRSQVMSRIRARDTSPEMRVRTALWAAGLRYRTHDKSLPGCPDIVFKRRRVAIFVHGCFWHAHEGCQSFRLPKSRRAWWIEKLAKTRLRDRAAKSQLESLGWRVIEVWECDLTEAHLSDVANEVSRLSTGSSARPGP